MYGVYNRSLSKSISMKKAFPFHGNAKALRCGMPNFSTSLFSRDIYSNRFETLSTLSEPDSPVPDKIGPKAALSPIVPQKEAKTKTKKALLNHPLRILIKSCH